MNPAFIMTAENTEPITAKNVRCDDIIEAENMFEGKEFVYGLVVTSVTVRAGIQKIEFVTGDQKNGSFQVKSDFPFRRLVSDRPRFGKTAKIADPDHQAPAGLRRLLQF